MFDLRTGFSSTDTTGHSGAKDEVENTAEPAPFLTFQAREMKTMQEIIKSDTSLSERQRVIMAALYTSSLIENNYETILAGHKLSGPQYNVLRILLGAHPNPLTITEIKGRILDRKSDVSRLIVRLQNAGYVHKKKPGDKTRTVLIQLTPNGLNLLERIAEHENEMLKPVFQFTEQEVLQFKNLLLKVIKTLTDG